MAEFAGFVFQQWKEHLFWGTVGILLVASAVFEIIASAVKKALRG